LWRIFSVLLDLNSNTNFAIAISITEVEITDCI